VDSTPTIHLLKQEINKTMEQEHDLAKWKLAAVAILGAAGLGLDNHNPGSSGSPTWLLLFIPFVCAYIDLYCYQYQIRIAVLARFLRGRREEDPVLQKYEEFCEEWRKKKGFSLGNWAGFGCSLFASLVGPVLHLWKTGAGAMDLSVSLLGVGIIVFLWVDFERLSRKLEGISDLKETEAAKPSEKRVATLPQLHGA
jgi:hypothetical protein